MIKFALYGKGGIGKSTVASNISAILSGKSLKVMQIGCDPKADSTALLRGHKKIPAVLDAIREKGKNVSLSDITYISDSGVVCVEAGGPIPGLGCAGRGIINALEKLDELKAFEEYCIDAVIYDVLGDVVCGGFSMPMRKGYAEKVFVVTSGEKMSCYAAANICMAVDNFKNRGYAGLGGIILNRRNVADEEKRCEELARDFGTSVIGRIDRLKEIEQAEIAESVLKNYAPGSVAFKQIETIAENIVSICGGE